MKKHVDNIVKSSWKSANPCLEIPLIDTLVKVNSFHDDLEDTYTNLSKTRDLVNTREVLFEKYDPKRRDWQLCVLDYI